MKVGDLVRFKKPEMFNGKLFLVTNVHGYGWHVSLMGFSENQVFQPKHLEVVSESVQTDENV